MSDMQLWAYQLELEHQRYEEENQNDITSKKTNSYSKKIENTFLWDSRSWENDGFDSISETLSY